MRRTMAAVALMLAAVLSACGSSTTGGSPAPGSTTPQPVPSSPTAQPSVSVTCDDLAEVATTLTTQVHYVALNVGTTNDSLTYYPAIDQAVAQLQQLVPECAPKAAEQTVALVAALDALKVRTMPGTDAAVIATSKDALADVREAGIALYAALKLPTAGWENRPENRVPG